MNTKGLAYENQAAAFLEERGYAIVERNWKIKAGEIDIIAERGDLLIFVEVRARSNVNFGTPGESVTAAKRKKIIKTAAAYMSAKKPPHKNYRFDVISIVPGRAPEHIEEAFDADGYGF